MAFSEVLLTNWQPCLFLAIGNLRSNETRIFFFMFYLTKCSKIFEVSWQPCPGVFTPASGAILKAEKGLGMRLWCHVWVGFAVGFLPSYVEGNINKKKKKNPI